MQASDTFYEFAVREANHQASKLAVLPAVFSTCASLERNLLKAPNLIRTEFQRLQFSVIPFFRVAGTKCGEVSLKETNDLVDCHRFSSKEWLFQRSQRLMQQSQRTMKFFQFFCCRFMGLAVGPVLRASGIVNPPVGVMRFANVFKKLAEAFLTWHVGYFSA